MVTIEEGNGKESEGELREDPREIQQNEVAREIERSQGPIPYWMIILIVIVYATAIILSLPILGNRTGQNIHTFVNDTQTRGSIDFGTVGGGAYLAAGFFVIYYVFMIRPRRKSRKQIASPPES